MNETKARAGKLSFPTGKWYLWAGGKGVLVLDLGDNGNGTYLGYPAHWRMGDGGLIVAETSAPIDSYKSEVFPGVIGQDGGPALMFIFDQYKDRIAQILPAPDKGFVTSRTLERGLRTIQK